MERFSERHSWRLTNWDANKRQKFCHNLKHISYCRSIFYYYWVQNDKKAVYLIFGLFWWKKKKKRGKKNKKIFYFAVLFCFLDNWWKQWDGIGRREEEVEEEKAEQIAENGMYKIGTGNDVSLILIKFSQ